MSHTIKHSAYTPLVSVSFAGEISNPIMKGAVPDYKATAQHLAGWVASLREALQREADENSSARTANHHLKRDHDAIAKHYTGLSTRHDKYLRASMRLRSHWLAFMFPRDMLYPHESED